MVNNIMLSAMAWASSLRTIAVGRLKEERGQDLLEYAVLAGGIGLALGALLLVGVGNSVSTSISTFVTKVGDCISFNSTCTK